jgi:hypothetical protein
MIVHLVGGPRSLGAVVLACALLAGCVPPEQTAAPEGTAEEIAAVAGRQGRVPAFAAIPYEPFSRAAAVAIAQREWRLFGQVVADEPPDSRPPPAPEDKPERQEGLWQRVGEYWWVGPDPDRPETAYTGMHNDSGRVFDAKRDGYYAWSAAFISYVMRIAGATTHFPYSQAHAHYINAARETSLGRAAGWAVEARRIDSYAPVIGDLVCFSRTRRPVRFDDLPTARTYPAHCAIVVATTPGEISVIGGNVDDAVALTHVPVTPEGMLAPAGGKPLDTRYAWFVVLKVNYER